MDFALNEEQRAWQMKARKFAAEEIRPISLERDAITDPQRQRLGDAAWFDAKRRGGEGDRRRTDR